MTVAGGRNHLETDIDKKGHKENMLKLKCNQKQINNRNIMTNKAPIFMNVLNAYFSSGVVQYNTSLLI